MPEKEISSQKCLQSYQACVGNTANLELPVTGESLLRTALQLLLGASNCLGSTTKRSLKVHPMSWTTGLVRWLSLWKHLPCKPNGLSLSPGALEVKGKNGLLGVVLWAPPHTQIQNKIIFYKKSIMVATCRQSPVRGTDSFVYSLPRLFGVNARS